MASSSGDLNSTSHVNSDPPPPQAFHFSSDVFARYPPDLADDGFISVSNRKGKKIPRSNPNFRSGRFEAKMHGTTSDLPSKADFPPLQSRYGPSAGSTPPGAVTKSCAAGSMKARSWRDVISGAQLSVNFPLTYYAPVIRNNVKCAEITSSLINSAKLKWDNSVVLYVLGSKPYYPYFKAYIDRVWKPTGSFQIFSKDNGFYVVKFEEKNDCDRILDNGPYYYDRKLIMMRRWFPGLKLTKEFLQTVQIWVRLLNLNLDHWTKESISRIASIIGRPIKMDYVTEGMIRISFARVLVEIDNELTFPNKVPLFDAISNTIIWQDIEYEWYSPKCSNCLCYGHLDRYCSFKKIWVPKDSVNTKEAFNTMDIDGGEVNNSSANVTFQQSENLNSGKVYTVHDDANVSFKDCQDIAGVMVMDNDGNSESEQHELVNLPNIDLNSELQIDKAETVNSDKSAVCANPEITANSVLNMDQEVNPSGIISDLIIDQVNVVNFDHSNAANNSQYGHSDILLQMTNDKDNNMETDNMKKLA